MGVEVRAQSGVSFSCLSHCLKGVRLIGKSSGGNHECTSCSGISFSSEVDSTSLSICSDSRKRHFGDDSLRY